MEVFSRKKIRCNVVDYSVCVNRMDFFVKFSALINLPKFINEP